MWHPSAVVAGALAGDILTSAAFTNGYPIDVVVAISSPNPRTYLVRIRQENGRISRSMEMPASAGFWVSPTIPEVHVSNNETLEVATKEDIVAEEEVQVTLFTRPAR